MIYYTKSEIRDKAQSLLSHHRHKKSVHTLDDRSKSAEVESSSASKYTQIRSDSKFLGFEFNFDTGLDDKNYTKAIREVFKLQKNGKNPLMDQFTISTGTTKEKLLRTFDLFCLKKATTCLRRMGKKQ